MIVHAGTTRHTRHGLHETWNGILLTKEDSLCVWNMLFIISTGRGTAAIHQRTEYGTLTRLSTFDPKFDFFHVVN